MSTTITAKDLRKGDVFTYGAHTYTAQNITTDEGTVKVQYDEGEYGMDFYTDSTVTLISRTTAPAAPAKPALSGAMAQYVVEAEKRLAFIKRAPHVDDMGERLFIWIDSEGLRRKRTYITEKGFLTAYIRELRRGAQDVICAD